MKHDYVLLIHEVLTSINLQSILKLWSSHNIFLNYEQLFRKVTQDKDI